MKEAKEVALAISIAVAIVAAFWAFVLAGLPFLDGAIDPGQIVSDAEQAGKDFAKSLKGDVPDTESEKVVKEMADKGGALFDKERAEGETIEGRIGDLKDWMSQSVRSLHWIRNDMEATDATLAAQGQQIKELATVTNNQAAVIRQNQKTVTALVGLLKQEGVIE